MRNNDWVGKRKAARQNCQMKAELRYLDGRKPIEVTIVDISATGCRVELPENLEAPEDFDLYIPSRSELKIGKVRRQEGSKLGVAFLRSRLDDPLVMQTLLERVGRLERGYSELKTLGPQDGAKDKRRSARNQEAEPVLAGQTNAESPNSEVMDIMSLELAGLRRTVLELVEAQAKAGADPSVRAAEFASEMNAIKEQMAQFSQVLLGSTSQALKDAPNFSADLAHMKAEMLNLSVSMREMAKVMPQTQVTVAQSAEASADSFQLAKIKAEIAQLRADIETQQNSPEEATSTPPDEAKAPVDEIMGSGPWERMKLLQAAEKSLLQAQHEPQPGQSEFQQLKREIAQVRSTVVDMTLSSGYSSSVSDHTAEIAALKKEIRALVLGLGPDGGRAKIAASSPPHAGESQAVDQTAVMSEIAKLRAEFAALQQAAPTPTGSALSVLAPSEFAVLKEEVRSLVLGLETNGGYAKIVASTASHAGESQAVDQTAVMGEIAQLRAEVAALQKEARTPFAPALADAAQAVDQFVAKDELAQLRAEVAALQKLAQSPNTPIHAASEHSEIADLRGSVQTLILLVSQSLNHRQAA